MGLKDILVHLDATARSDVRLGIATELALRHEAHLTGLFLKELPSLAMFMGDTSVFDMRMADDILRQGRDHAEKVSGTVKARFEEACRRNGLESEWRSVEDGTAKTVALHARYADLAVVGQADPAQFAAPGEAHIPETVILESGRPVLVIPYFGDVKPIGNTVLVGWKSGREAARAVNDALPLLTHAKSVTVLAINPEAGVSEEGRLPAADIALHLARHNVTATASHTETGGIAEGDVLLNYVSDLGADLIIAGGYGHSRAREFVLGGATRSLLSTVTVPVMFSH